MNYGNIYTQTVLYISPASAEGLPHFFLTDTGDKIICLDQPLPYSPSDLPPSLVGW